MEILKTLLSRRRFLQATGAVGAVGATGLGGGVLTSLGEAEAAPPAV